MASYFIIDGNNLAHRAHNSHFKLKKANGDPSGMFFGFVRILISLKKKYRAFKFIVVWDSRPEKKYELKPDYKAGRSRLPGKVFDQIGQIKEFLSNCGVDQYKKKGEEADDVIATLVRRYSEEDSKVYIYSNDKDLLQLVKDGKVIVFRPKVGNTPEKFFDEEAVKEQFNVGPEKLALYRSFDGDSSDNIDGVPRVRRKLIASVVNHCEDIKGIFNKLEDDDIKKALSEKEYQAILKHLDTASLNYKIIKLNEYIETLDKTEAKYSEGVLASILEEFEIKSLKPESIIDLFKNTLNIKYTEPQQAIKLETYSLFD